MSDQSPPKVGIWRAFAGLGNYRAKHLIWPEGVPAVLIGAVGAALVTRSTVVADRTDVMGDLVALAGALLAVVFAALAIVVSLPSSRYLRALQETEDGGIQRFLDPFLVAVGTQIVVLLGALGYGLMATHVPWWVEHVIFDTLGFVFVYGVLDVGALARSLVRHGILRSVAASEEDREDANGSADIRPFRDRRSSS